MMLTSDYYTTDILSLPIERNLVSILNDILLAVVAQSKNTSVKPYSCLEISLNLVAWICYTFRNYFKIMHKLFEGQLLVSDY